MPIYILVTGPSLKDRICFAHSMVSKLNYEGFTSSVLENKRVGQMYLNQITDKVFGEGYLADGEWLTAFMNKMRTSGEVDWASEVGEAIQNEMSLGYQVIVVPDLTFMNDLTMLYPSSYGYVHLEREGVPDISLSTPRESDYTFAIGDDTDIIEAGLTYAKELLESLQSNGDLESYDGEDYPVEKPEINDMSMFG